MQKSINRQLCEENRVLKQKIENLQRELHKKNREFSEDESFDFKFLLTIIGTFIILVCLYPFFRFGWFLINFNHF